MAKVVNSQKESMTYQTMLEEVEQIVRSVSSANLDLDEVVAKVERGYKLIRDMRTRLDTTKAKVETLRTEFEKDLETTSVSEPHKSNSAHQEDSSDEDDDTPF